MSCKINITDELNGRFFKMRVSNKLACVIASLFFWITSAFADCDTVTQQVAVGQGHISYNLTGKGPAVLLLHGLFAQKEQWNEVACALSAAGYQAIAPDLPGYGLSNDYGLEVYPLETQVALLANFVRNIDVQPAHVAGNSMGGAIAALYAQAHPDTTRTLAFVGGTFGIGPWAHSVRAAIFSGINPFIPLTPTELDHELAMLLDRPPTLSAEVKATLLAPYQQNTGHYVQVWNIVNLYSQTLTNKKPHQIPTLIMWGDADQVFDRSSSSLLAKRFPNSKSITLPNTGHLAMLDSPVLVSTTYIRFLAKQPSVRK